ncbi:lysozyme inhibitor LprI family protein [Clostridium taeniosporum]|uniref:DUF1311 domain-containing protein n=1 Tax=Clostridium taeniosporum TaxID=394958 RepID=A0A1D7XPE8_9CLOT|nr:lysozyme inhibitor LprI family protein [Clostridium taeniosporum]AOR25177.1 DUF1311 domain-containing protein [Clostridium taeniosporum]
MKQKAILCLVLIGLTSFNFIGCTNSDKNITSKNEQQENISTEDSETKTDNNSDTETDKAKNNTDNNINKSSQNSNKEVNNKKTEKSVKENNNNAKKTQQSTKQIYKNKLNNIELGMKDLDEKDATGINMTMISAATERNKRWDDALNEIYGVLKEQLSSDDMKKLENEEIKWISYRDDKAKNDSSPYKGGSIYSYIYTSSLAETTKERCYKLVEKYMK